MAFLLSKCDGKNNGFTKRSTSQFPEAVIAMLYGRRELRLQMKSRLLTNGFCDEIIWIYSGGLNVIIKSL